MIISWLIKEKSNLGRIGIDDDYFCPKVTKIIIKQVGLLRNICSVNQYLTKCSRVNLDCLWKPYQSWWWVRNIQGGNPQSQRIPVHVSLRPESPLWQQCQLARCEKVKDKAKSQRMFSNQRRTRRFCKTSLHHRNGHEERKLQIQSDSCCCTTVRWLLIHIGVLSSYSSYWDCISQMFCSTLYL